MERKLEPAHETPHRKVIFGRIGLTRISLPTPAAYRKMSPERRPLRPKGQERVACAWAYPLTSVCPRFGDEFERSLYTPRLTRTVRALDGMTAQGCLGLGAISRIF